MAETQRLAGSRGVDKKSAFTGARAPKSRSRARLRQPERPSPDRERVYGSPSGQVQIALTPWLCQMARGRSPSQFLQASFKLPSSFLQALPCHPLCSRSPCSRSPNTRRSSFGARFRCAPCAAPSAGATAGPVTSALAALRMRATWRCANWTASASANTYKLYTQGSRGREGSRGGTGGPVRASVRGVTLNRQSDQKWSEVATSDQKCQVPR